MSATQWKNLAVRDGDSRHITLDYGIDDDTQQPIVRVAVQGQDDFILYPPNSQALDCFYHPYAYLNRVLQSGSYQTVREQGNADTLIETEAS